MALARARALRTLQSSFRSSRRPVPRISTTGRTQLVQRRYASDGGAGHGAATESSDIPWLIGAIAVTVPSCWYLWPDTSHADHHGGHGEHEEHEEGEEGEEKSEDAGEGEEKQEENSEEGEKEQGQEEGSDGSKEESGGEGEQKEKSSDDSKSEQKEGDTEDVGSTNKKEGSERDTPSGEGDEGDNEEQETKPGGGAGKEEMSGTEQVANQRKLKKKPDSGQQLGQGPEFEENEQGGPKKESAATSKEQQKGKSGEITGKQFGLSTGDTKHSLPIDSDPNKSKKGEGTPETAKASGTVDPNRPAK